MKNIFNKNRAKTKAITEKQLAEAIKKENLAEGTEDKETNEMNVVEKGSKKIVKQKKIKLIR